MVDSLPVPTWIQPDTPEVWAPDAPTSAVRYLGQLAHYAHRDEAALPFGLFSPVPNGGQRRNGRHRGQETARSPTRSTHSRSRIILHHSRTRMGRSIP